MSKKIIKKFGGVQSLASKMKLSVSTVHYWWVQNYVPIKKQPAVFALAKSLNIKINPADFAYRGPGDS